MHTKIEAKLSRFQESLKTFTAEGLAWWVGAFVYAGVVLSQIFAKTGEVFEDSVRYLPPVSWLDPAQPGILTTFLFSFMPSHEGIVVLLLITFVLSWILFAWEIWHFFKGTFGFALSFVVLCFSLTTPILSWQWVLLTDGLCISIFILWASTMLALLRRLQIGEHPSRYPIIWNLIAFALLNLARPQLLLVALPLNALLLYQYLRRSRRGVLIPITISYAIPVIWSGIRLALSQNTQGTRAWFAEDNYVARESYRAFASASIGECNYFNKAVESWGNLASLRHGIESQCPDAFSWLDSNASGVLSWILNTPIGFAREFLNWAMGAKLLTYSMQNGILTVANDPGDVFIRTPAISITVIALIVGLVLSGMSGLEVRERVFSRAGYVGLTWIFCLGYIAITWGADGMEPDRHVMPIMPLIPILALLTVPALVGQSRGLPDSKWAGSSVDRL